MKSDTQVLVLGPGAAGRSGVQRAPPAVPIPIRAAAEGAPPAVVPRHPVAGGGVACVVVVVVVVAAVSRARTRHGVRHGSGRAGLGPRRQRVHGRRGGGAQRVRRGRRRRVDPARRAPAAVGRAAGPAPVHVSPLDGGRRPPVRAVRVLGGELRVSAVRVRPLELEKCYFL
jgi:hypothetical protein